MQIRDATPADWPAIYPIFSAITTAGRTYAYPENATSDVARELWMGQRRVVVAAEADKVLGTATMGPNRPGRGAHIATGSVMVAQHAQGRGAGRQLGEHLIDWCRHAGFRGIQFNAVVETNAAAVHLWQSLGFAIIGTVPGAFLHPDDGYVGLHIMFLPLVAELAAPTTISR
jgi:L-amino acid N-acyltransferase YncA